MAILRLVLIAVLVTLAVPAPAHAAPVADPAGTWTTRLSCPQGDFDLRVTVSSTGADRLAATFRYSRKVDDRMGVSNQEMSGRYAPPRVLLALVDRPGKPYVDLTLVAGTPDRLIGNLPAWGCGQVELVRQASNGPAPLSASCTVAVAADSFGTLLLAPGAAAGTMLVLFLIFGSRGRISGTIAAIGWAFGGTVRRIIFGLVLLAAAAGGALMLVADHYGAGCPG